MEKVVDEGKMVDLKMHSKDAHKSAVKGEKVAARRTQSKGLKEKEEELVAEALIVPPDGGWGWVIVAASFMTNAVVDGIIFTVGQGLLPVWTDEFTGGSSSMAAWTTSLLSGCYLLVGPIVSSVANNFGCRITAMIGTFIACTGFILSMFATNIWLVYLTFGLMGGIGLGFIYLPSIVIVSYYFEKRRALATGIAVCGSGIGTFVCAPLIRSLLQTYTWRPTMLILAGLILHCLIFASLYRKLTPTRRQMAQISRKLHDYDEQQYPKALAPESSSNVQLPSTKRTQPLLKMTSSEILPATGLTSASTTATPALSEMAQRPASFQDDGGVVVEQAPPNGLMASGVQFERFVADGSDIDQAGGAKRRTTSAVQQVFRSTMDLSYYRRRTNPLVDIRHRRSCVSPEKNDQESPLTRLTVDYGANAESDDDPVYEEASKRSVDLLNRPLSRMDIFYSGSVQNLPQFKSQPDVRHFLASTISLTLAVEKEDKITSDAEQKEMTKGGIKGAILNMLDFSLFSSPTFILLALSGFFTLTGFFVPFIYLPAMAKSFGHTSEQATMLVSALGVVNIVARILCGYVSDGLPRCGRRKPLKLGPKVPARTGAKSDGKLVKCGSSASLQSSTPPADSQDSDGEDEPPRSPALFINNTALILAGLATMIVPHWKSYPLLILYCVIFGTGTACFASLRSVICVQLLGLERLTNAYGLLLLFMGIASLVGSPLAGFLFDQTKTFNLSFYIMGALVAISGLLGIPLPYISRWEKRRSEKCPRTPYSTSADSQDNGEVVGGSSTAELPPVKRKTKSAAPSIVVYKAPETLDEADEEANINTVTSSSNKALKNGLSKIVKT